MAIYDINGNVISYVHNELEGGSMCFNRVYSYINPLLTCERKLLNNDGTKSDSTTRCLITLPKHGSVEVKQQKNSKMFKVAKVNGSTVTWLDSVWSYYSTRYIGDGSSVYYAQVAVSSEGTSELTIDAALDGIAVYQFIDIGERREFISKLNGKHIAFIGDSITQGRFRKFSDSGLTWTATKPFGSIIAEYANDMDYGNYGIGGALVTTKVNAWMALVNNCSKVVGYDTVFICGGTNDYGNNVSSSDFTTAYNTVVDTLKANNSEVIACTPVYRTSKTGSNTQGLTLEDYCTIIKNVAVTKNINYIDLYPLTNDGVFITYCPDGLHPTENGHKIMADLILKQYEMFV